MSKRKSAAPKKLKLTLDQEQALSHLEANQRNLFITGGAGTGKSTLIRYFLSKSTEKIPVLASTGAAAIIVGGRTFHSFFGLGIMQGGLQAILEKASKNRRLKKRVCEASRIIIDEVSMLSFEAVDAAEKIARMIRGSDEPWGGIRIIAVGDFAQLPPVSRGAQKEWAFLGEAWASSGFKILSLNEIVRTEDESFMEVLADLRVGKLSVRLKHFLKTHVRYDVESDVTHLFPRRDQTELFNRARLAEISEPSKIYPTIYSGDSFYTEKLKKDAPIPETLELKKGALVMIRMNDPKQRFVNGTTGHIVDLRDGGITIQTATRTVDLEPFAFTVLNEEGVEVASACNFPVTLAYASTIHKVQGATLDRLHVDLQGLWEPGQAYVALSRARRAQDVTISRWTPSSIKADPYVAAFYSGLDPNEVSAEKRALLKEYGAYLEDDELRAEQKFN